MNKRRYNFQPNKSGIYKITNPKNKVYVGYATSIQNRYYNYFLKNKFNLTKIETSLKEFSFDKHKFEIIELCNINLLKKREKYWIKKFDSFNNGLNENNGGGGPIFHTEETKKLISNKKKGQKYKYIEHKGKNILQFDLQGNFLNKFKSASKAGKSIKGNGINIADAARGKYKSTYGYQWRYEDKLSEEQKKFINPITSNQGNHNKWTEERRIKIKNSRKGEKRSKEYAEKIRKLKLKPIYRIDKDNNIELTFTSGKLVDGSGIIGSTKLGKILNKDIFYKGFKYTNLKPQIFE